MLTPAYKLPGIPVQTKLLPRAERRASILTGAAAAFAEAGFAHTSMDDVAAACGVTKLILYRHFETKEELYRAVLQRVFDRLGEELQAGLSARGTTGVGARTLLVVAREDPAAFTLLWRHASREPQFTEYARELQRISVDVVGQLAGLGEGLLARWEAAAMWAWLVEATLTWLAQGDATLDDVFVERTTAGLRALRAAWR